MNAILTPSTKGLRHVLTENDINFSMPLMQNNNSNSNNNNNNNSTDFSGDKNENNSAANEDSFNKSTRKSIDNKESISNNDENQNDSNQNVDDENLIEKNGNNDDDDDDNDDYDEVCRDDDEPDEWLEQMGLNSAVNFKASILQRNSKNKKKDSFLNFDNRPRSTLLFDQASDVQALFNFLLNSKTCVSSSGPMTGIPPTLLSPTPFIGANLQKIKIEQNVIKTLTKSGDPLTQYALDFVGPVMPYHTHRLCNLFRLTNGGFEMKSNAYESTVALNCIKSDKNNSKTDGYIDKEQENSIEKDFSQEAHDPSSFLDASESNSLRNNYGVFGEPQAIKYIQFANDKFSCNYSI
jgi:hypothetical protein